MASKVFQMDEDQYRAIEAVSQSELRTMLLGTPRDLWLNRQRKQAPNEYQAFGTLFHMAILESEKFSQSVACEPDRLPDGRKAGIGDKDSFINRNTTEWKEFIGRWREDNKQRMLVEAKDFHLLMKMMKATHSHPKATDIIRNSSKEQKTLWTCDWTGEKCKGAADLTGLDLADLKSTKCKTPGEFMNDCYRKLVHLQMGFYDVGFGKAGLSFDNHYLIGVEKDLEKEEVGCFVVRMEKNLLERGIEVAKRAMELYSKCQTSKKWPGHETKVYDWTIPPWDLVEQGDSNAST